MEERLDKKLSKMLEITRSKAQDLITNGQVTVNGVIETKSSHHVLESDSIEVTKGEHDHYVGRGAVKLLDALKHFNVDIKDKIAIDVGASTGGFTQVLLENHVTKVYAIDVGHDQLVHSLKSNSKVVSMEGINIKDLMELPEIADLAVVDLSFISLNKVINNISHLVKAKGDIILLFKPQFEVGKKFINKNGVVRDEKISETCLNDFIDFVQKEGFIFENKIHCSIKGKEGNQEHLIHLFNKEK